MTSSSSQAPDQGPGHEPGHGPVTDPDQKHADRCYRSAAGIASGVLLLALIGWLGGDAIVRGEGNAPWLALAGLLFAVPLTIAFTVRPAVWASEDRLLVRNPFRTITLPWATVEAVRAGYSSEVLAGGAKYQLWAIPVSLRQRKTAARRAARDVAQDVRVVSHGGGALEGPVRAPSDQAVEDLRELAERCAGREGAQGVPVVRWAYELIVPALVGLVLVVALGVAGG
ncbi:PH domain-containing protein [Streptomyces griseocarneus]|uniref:PH domain-containing protein n=1 Tax=Streptomyces griseocarneus TaxID=51201 RepID=UPI00167EDA87|nr:PH domain-containing protein [Streptomyces griseocarneus]MBZ6474026.1 PH domain-containing protein [Streptomyces griseocarneus]GHG66419.1 membrane protein [Streptomyces griseocarneus]